MLGYKIKWLTSIHKIGGEIFIFDYSIVVRINLSLCCHFHYWWHVYLMMVTLGHTVFLLWLKAIVRSNVYFHKLNKVYLSNWIPFSFCFSSGSDIQVWGYQTFDSSSWNFSSITEYLCNSANLTNSTILSNRMFLSLIL